MTSLILRQMETGWLGAVPWKLVFESQEGGRLTCLLFATAQTTNFGLVPWYLQHSVIECASPTGCRQGALVEYATNLRQYTFLPIVCNKEFYCNLIYLFLPCLALPVTYYHFINYHIVDCVQGAILSLINIHLER